MKTLLAIVFHAAADSLVDRHLPFWNAAVGADNVRLYCGADQLALTRHQDRATGISISGHSGAASISRYLGVMAHALHSHPDHEQFVIGESDTVLFRPPPAHPMDGSMIAPLFRNTEPHRFEGEFYAHPIQFCDREALAKIVQNMTLQTMDFNEGYGDRWIGALCPKIGVGLENSSLLYSRNSLDTPEYISQAQECLRGGGWACHGVKTAAQLDALVSAM